MNFHPQEGTSHLVIVKFNGRAVPNSPFGYKFIESKQLVVAGGEVEIMDLETGAVEAARILVEEETKTVGGNCLGEAVLNADSPPVVTVEDPYNEAVPPILEEMPGKDASPRDKV